MMVAADPGDKGAWAELRRYVSRQGGWDACRALRTHVECSLTSEQRANFARGFLRSHPDRDSLIFQHRIDEAHQVSRGALPKLISHLGHRDLWIEEIGVPAPWSSIRGLRWALECVLHSGGMVTMQNPRHHASPEAMQAFAGALQVLYQVARDDPRSFPDRETLERAVRDSHENPAVQELLRRPQRRSYYASGAPSFARGIAWLLSGSFGQAATSMLRVVPSKVRDAERRWHLYRLWMHLMLETPPRASWVGGFLPDWQNDNWQETEPRLVIPAGIRV
jgi:hypothetical protein